MLGCSWLTYRKSLVWLHYACLVRNTGCKQQHVFNHHWWQLSHLTCLLFIQLIWVLHRIDSVWYHKHTRTIYIYIFSVRTIASLVSLHSWRSNRFEVVQHTTLSVLRSGSISWGQVLGQSCQRQNVKRFIVIIHKETVRLYPIKMALRPLSKITR